MIEWTFAPQDVARIRFAFSPLAELVLSLIVLREPSRHSLHVRWVRATSPRLAGLDLSELFGLVPVRGDVADFLTPPPTSPLPDFAAELALVRSTPPARVVAELAAVPELAQLGAAPAPDALAALLGRTRATMLLALAEPVSTTTLAGRLSITPGAVSQHLSVLLDCGLVTRSRVGRSVLYHRTRTGDVLVTARRT